MRKIVVFGMGKNTEKNWESINREYCVAAILDNLVTQGEMLYFKNVPVYNPHEYRNLEQLPILITVDKYLDITKQLRGLGICEKDIWILNNALSEDTVKYITLEDINNVKKLPKIPIHDDWGYRRGTPIGRVYIDKFLKKYRENVVGDIMEVGECTYSRRFATNGKSYTAIHVEDVEGCRKANLETGEGLKSEEFDTMIITQTLAYIYDIQSVVRNIYNCLRKNGHCLVTVTDIGHMGNTEREKWGAFWGFHKDGCYRVFSEVFGKDNVNVEVYGNLKAVVAQLYGLAAEDVESEIIDEFDAKYPMIIGIVAHKV